MPRATFGSKVIEFYRTLRAPRLHGLGVDALYPFRDPLVRQLVAAFYSRFFDDVNPRRYVIGINPGRFGGGTTGIPFTDPVSLSEQCGIANPLPRRRELSAIFVEALIERFGGPRNFYRQYFITAASPIGFTRDGKNYNYYDSPELLNRLRPFIGRTLQQQLDFGAHRDVAVVLGTGKNLAFLGRLNDELRLFGKLVAVDHPRFIMQYRRPHMQRFLDKYELALTG
ncbi:MAG TPA: uracil-DNA glycosylase family protein [Gemmatimonadaceae bacterium]